MTKWPLESFNHLKPLAFGAYVPVVMAVASARPCGWRVPVPGVVRGRRLPWRGACLPREAGRRQLGVCSRARGVCEFPGVPILRSPRSRRPCWRRDPCDLGASPRVRPLCRSRWDGFCGPVAVEPRLGEALVAVPRGARPLAGSQLPRRLRLCPPWRILMPARGAAPGAPWREVPTAAESRVACSRVG